MNLMDYREELHEWSPLHVAVGIDNDLNRAHEIAESDKPMRIDYAYSLNKV